MELYKCDLSMSVAEFLKAENNYGKGMCYNNAFIALTNHFTDKSARGVVGYVLSSDGKRKVAVRHAWVKIVDKYVGEPRIIDVTMFANECNPISVMSYDYLPVKELTPGEWSELTDRNGGMPCIENLDGEADIIKDLESQGYEILVEAVQEY